MQVKVLCVGLSDETWFKGTKDERKVKQLNLLDTDTFCQVKETFDYVIPKEEEDKLDPEALRMSTFTLGVSVWQKENGRLKASRGKIDLGTVPAVAFRRVGSPGAEQPLPASAGSVQGKRDVGDAVLSNGSMSAGPNAKPKSGA